VREVLKDVRGIELHADKPRVGALAEVQRLLLSFQVDPNLVFNFRESFKEALGVLNKQKSETSSEDTKIKHLLLLVDYLDNEYGPTADRLRSILDHGEITFDLLWALFVPNTLLYYKDQSSEEARILKLDWGHAAVSQQLGKYFNLKCRYVNCNGKSFGDASTTLLIREFRGAMRIEQMRTFPLEYHPDTNKVKQKLIERGKKFTTFRGTRYVFYHGLAHYKKKDGVVKLHVTGRIMVDPVTFKKVNPNYRVDYSNPLTRSPNSNLGWPSICEDDVAADSELGSVLEGGDEGDLDEGDGGDINMLSTTDADSSSRKRAASGELHGIGKKVVLSSDDMVDSILSNNVRVLGKQSKYGARKKVVSRELSSETMTEEQLLLCSPVVLGFSLTDKLWLELAVEHISEIQFNPAAFDCLVLPESQKTIVQALVESHSAKKKQGIDDLIKGKGRGLVVVLQ
jgi:hypothetical protein